MELYTDKELIEEYLKTGSNRAARLLVAKHKEMIFSVALNFTKSFEDAEDLAQETFIKAFANLETFQYKSSLRTWLYKILKNLYLNGITKKNIENTMQRQDVDSFADTLGGYSDPANEYEYKEFLKHFKVAIDSLPKKQREVFWLRYFDDLKYEDISEMLDITVGGLKANYYHAIKKITEILKDYK